MLSGGSGSPLHHRARRRSRTRLRRQRGWRLEYIWQCNNCRAPFRRPMTSAAVPRFHSTACGMAEFLDIMGDDEAEADVPAQTLQGKLELEDSPGQSARGFGATPS